MKNNQKMEKLYYRQISDAIIKIKQDDLKNVIINDVSLIQNGETLKIFVNFKQVKLISKLNQKKAYFRKYLAQRSKVYKVPEVLFVKDEAEEKYAKIENILEKIKGEK